MKTLDISDFHLKRRLGDGSYSDVVLVQLRHHLKGSEEEEEEETVVHDGHNYYALKIVDKYHIVKHGAVGQLQLERRLLEMMNDEDCTVRLYFTFQDSANVYLGLEPCLYGELYDAIGQLDMEDIVFYAAEIVVMLDMLRRYGVVHRDLKPENVLLGHGGHLKLIDFGSAYCLDSTEDHRGESSSALVGTAEYVAVEILEHRDEITHGVDLWAFGCILYQMCTGKTPFRGASEYLTFQNILQGEIEYEGFESLPSGGKDARDLVERLLQRDPMARIGFSSLDEIRSHAFFDSIDTWDTLYDREETPYFTRVLYPATTVSGGGLPNSLLSEETDEEDWELTSLAAHAARLNVSDENNISP